MHLYLPAVLESEWVQIEKSGQIQICPPIPFLTGALQRVDKSENGFVHSSYRFTCENVKVDKSGHVFRIFYIFLLLLLQYINSLTISSFFTLFSILVHFSLFFFYFYFYCPSVLNLTKEQVEVYKYKDIIKIRFCPHLYLCRQMG